MKKELIKPQMIRLTDSLKETIQESADKHNKGNFNREVRDLIQIGLKNRKRGEKNKYGLIALTFIKCTKLAHIAANVLQLVVRLPLEVKNCLTINNLI